ncbi:LacI family DNA-binding transcriptional regulator [Mycoplasmopsis cricetuli]|uniref:LacI family DNA-binding transcriptional regulator n=1 Tax=Mycoplasmopsis cricetuli TaxID=171283 RepID=UPI00055C25CD|nr:LacI family DNA-binding transcriptional regulator [Mycoplasmopsis cricetuli]
MNKQISYKDISNKAGVSVSTISRYFNNGYVSRNTKMKIDEVIKVFQYYPGYNGRLLKTKDSSVFIVMPEWTQNLYFSIINGIVYACKKSNRKVNITFTCKDTNDYIDTIKYILTSKPSSIIIFNPEYDEELFAFLKNIEDVTIVVYEHKVNGLNWIKIDEVEAFYKVTKSLINNLENSKNKLLFLEDAKLTLIQKNDRFLGFEQACKDSNVEFEKYEVSFNNSKNLNEFIEFSRKKAFSNIVCSTHESYISLCVQGQQSLNLTDIGYQSFYDKIKKYKSKIFIDYPAIGIEIERIISAYNEEKKLQQKLIKTKIVVHE